MITTADAVRAVSQVTTNLKIVMNADLRSLFTRRAPRGIRVNSEQAEVSWVRGACLRRARACVPVNSHFGPVSGEKRRAGARLAGDLHW